MATNVPVYGAKSVAHLDPTDDQHLKDYLWAKKDRERRAQILEIQKRIQIDPNARFTCLGRGLMLDRNGKTLSSKEFNELVNHAVKSRSTYIYREHRKDGRVARKRRKTKGVRNHAVTFRPDIDTGLKLLDAQQPFNGLILSLILDCSKMVATEFEILTDYEVLAVSIHPNEGVLHFHLVYATVSADGERLGDILSSSGNPRAPNMGPRNLGLVRLANAGLRTREEARIGFLDLERIELRSGGPPVDITLAQTVDAFWETHADSDGQLKKCLDDGRAAYLEGRERKATEAAESKMLAMLLNEKEAEITSLQAENESLKSEVERIQKNAVKALLKASVTKHPTPNAKEPRS